MEGRRKTAITLLFGALIGIYIGIELPSLITEFKSIINTEEKSKEETKEKDTNTIDNNETITALDDLVLKNDIHLKEEEIYDFIHSSSNLSGWQSENFNGAMFNEEISNEFKLFYTLNRVFGYVYQTNDIYSGELVSLKKDTIEILAKQLFLEYEFPEKITKDAWYAGTHDVICDDTKCVFISDTFSILGPAQNEYEGPITKEDTKYIVRPICIEFENEKFLDNEDDMLVDIVLKDRHNGNTIKTLEQQKLSSIENEEDERNLYYKSLSKYYTNIDTYTYEFNEDNVLVSVKKA